MQVELIDFTGSGHKDPARHAANILVFTKSTRLEMSPGLMAQIADWSEDRITEELRYMAGTIPSSWEFIDYTFIITGVTRAFTHQFVRTRTGSYAQQTMRVLNVNGWGYETGPTIQKDPACRVAYDGAMKRTADEYDWLIENGAAIEDARGILPTNIHTNIVAKFNLRTLADTMRKRASGRTQGEYREVLEKMKGEILRVHPWAELFFSSSFDKAAADLEAALRELASDHQGMDSQAVTRLVKMIDVMRGTA
jgi:thymidylate synthase (FAD)